MPHSLSWSAASPFSPARIMARAWELFRERYAYPNVPFRSIGRACFNACLKAAWHEAREVVRLAALGVDALKASLTRAQAPVHRVGLSTSYSEDGHALVARLWQIRVLSAALALAVA